MSETLAINKPGNARQSLVPVFVFIFLSALLLANNYINLVYLMGPVRGQSSYLSEDYTFTWKNFLVFNYSLHVIGMVFKLLLVSLILKAGLHLYKEQVGFLRIFTLVCIAELAFFLSKGYKAVKLLFLMDSYSLDFFRNYEPLSLHGLLELEEVENLLAPLWQLANGFELLYILTLAIGLHVFLRKSFDRSLLIVLSSYGVMTLLYTFFKVLI